MGLGDRRALARQDRQAFQLLGGANLSDSQNELVKYEGSNVIQEGVVPLLEGYPLNTIWGYRTAGLYQETPAMEEAILQPGGALTAAGDVRYVNRDSDPYITGGNFTPDSPGDLVMLGTTDPRYTFGADLGFEWKGLRFSVQLQGVGKRNFLLDEATLNPTQGSLYQAINIHRDYWTPENTDAFMPRPVYKGGSYNYKPSDRWIQDAAYLRLKTSRSAIRFPSNRGVSSVRVMFMFPETICGKQPVRGMSSIRKPLPSPRSMAGMPFTVPLR